MFSHYCVKTFGIENVSREFLFAGSSLVVFFSLQGFLVIPSALRNNLGKFAKKRILRLYPSYTLSLIFTISVVCLAGFMPNLLETLLFFTRELLFFDGIDFHGVSNGAIWAIFIQLQVYIVVFFTAKRIVRMNSMKLWTLFLLFLMSLNYMDAYILSYMDKVGLHYVGAVYTHLFIRYAYFFWIGMFAYRFYDRWIPILYKYAYLLLAIHIVWHMDIISLPKGYCYTDPITVITASLAALGVAYRIGSIKLKYEISYDVFVWHMPVYTALKLFVQDEGWPFIIFCIIITILLSFMSNFFTRKIVSLSN